jgi:hypothetical protein
MPGRAGRGRAGAFQPRQIPVTPHVLPGPALFAPAESDRSEREVMQAVTLMPDRHPGRVATQPVKLNPASTLVGRSRTMSSPGTPLRLLSAALDDEPYWRHQRPAVHAHVGRLARSCTHCADPAARAAMAAVGPPPRPCSPRPHVRRRARSGSGCSRPRRRRRAARWRRWSTRRPAPSRPAPGRSRSIAGSAGRR